MQFRKAERKKAKLRLALAGPSGSGKTYSALLIAKGLGGPVAVVDTERGSSELYADNGKIDLDFDVLQLEPPYNPSRYIEAIRAAKKGGYNVVIIDSGSHAWMGEGGMLDEVDKATKANKGNTMAGWKAVAPLEKKFLEAITGTDIHIIMTLRTKTEWEISKDEKSGKTKPVKVGLKPEQRAGIEYEFTVAFDLSVDGNIATASKDRTDLFADQYFTPTEETGKTLLAWLNSGKEVEASKQPESPESPPQPDKPKLAKKWQLDKLIELGGDADVAMYEGEVKEMILHFRKGEKLTYAEAEDLINHFNERQCEYIKSFNFDQQASA